MSDELEKQLIKSFMSEGRLQRIDRLDVLESTVSTNDYVMSMALPNKDKFIVCIADQQTAGKGRNGRQWQSPGNANVYMSVGCYMSGMKTDQFGALSLICAVAVARLLESLGLAPAIKWPNDILINRRKVAGILIESRIRSNSVFVVTGIGMNVKMPETSADKIDQPWIDLQQAFAPGKLNISRCELAARLIEEIIGACQNFQLSGFAMFKNDWQRLDVLTGQQVLVKSAGEEFSAKVIGLDKNFGLQVEVDQELRVLHAADIKLTLEQDAGN